MTAREASWPEVLDAVLTGRLRSVHTSLPATVRSYDSTTKLATVELATHIESVTDGFEAVPPLADVPVLWPGGGGYIVHAPLAAGDRVLVIFAEESFSKWLDTGSVEPPEVLIRHGLHAVAIPLMVSSVAVSATKLTVGGSGEVLLGDATATDLVALGPAVSDQLQGLKDAINGWLPVPNDGGAALKVALGTWLASSSAVSATKVKAK